MTGRHNNQQARRQVRYKIDNTGTITGLSVQKIADRPTGGQSGTVTDWVTVRHSNRLGYSQAQ